MTSHFVRIVCPHCGAVIETDTAVAAVNVLCGACRSLLDWRFENGRVEDHSLNQAAPHESVMAKFNTNVSLDTVFLPAVVRLRQHGAVLLLTALAVNLIWFALIGLPADALVALWSELTSSEAGDIRLLAVTLGGTGLVGLLIAPVSAYSMIALIRLSLRISRHGDRDRGVGTVKRVGIALQVPAMTVARLTFLFIAIGMLAVCLLGMGLIAIVILSFSLEPQTATLVGVFGVGAILTGVLLVLQWLLWPAIFLIADERTDLTTGVSWGVRLALKNRKLTLALVTVYFVLATLGSMLFYIGQIVTTPLAVLPMAAGYLSMTGGRATLDKSDSAGQRSRGE